MHKALDSLGPKPCECTTKREVKMERSNHDVTMITKLAMQSELPYGVETQPTKALATADRGNGYTNNEQTSN